ncbi:Regulator of drug sensitivity 2 [Cytospora mali]|uniref:Regulator of drug sensitivity 2 n=1 Tax=Cytospora mali TaxID=578113 RepID=A0A194VBP0_CYTMA|nr:Regulator of drug sensitivity 2 [Valsa mali var. pyri (nom. inval.)]
MDRKKKNGPNGSDDQDRQSGNDSKSRPAHTGSATNNDTPRASTSTSSDKEGNKSHAHAHAPDDANNKPGPQKKRRKVTHEHDNKKARGSTVAGSTMDESDTQSDVARSSIDHTANIAVSAAAMRPTSFDGGGITAGAAGSLGRGNSVQLVRPTQVPGLQASGSGSSNMNQFAGFSDAWLTAQNQLQDMQNYQSNYLIAPEVSNEFNLLNEFLNSSLLDDAGLLSGDSDHTIKNDHDMLPNYLHQHNLLPPSALPGGQPMQPPGNPEQNPAIARPAPTVPEDKQRRDTAEFYLQVADPSGNDTPEARMERVLRAKYDAGLLKPFNYIQGYKRLQDYLESHIAPTSKQKILAQIHRFRPMFREKVQKLTDIQLVYVEMWFEKTLMEYDRVFASMAVPACCWRRTGEIFRGNKEMAELIGVQVEDLRDGKIALHSILTEASVVRYWEEFGTIAFDPAHDTLLTACVLKTPIDNVRAGGKSKERPMEIKCCFSLKIRRDDAKM